MDKQGVMPAAPLQRRLSNALRGATTSIPEQPSNEFDVCYVSHFERFLRRNFCLFAIFEIKARPAAELGVQSHRVRDHAA